MSKPNSKDERREQLIAEFEKTTEELRVLKARAQRLQAELGELKSGGKPKAVVPGENNSSFAPSLSKPAPSKPQAAPPKERSSKPVSKDDDFLMLGGVSD